MGVSARRRLVLALCWPALWSLMVLVTKGQHLRAAVEITPLPAGPNVAMPAIQTSEAASYIEKAFAAVTERLDVQEQAMFNRGAKLSPGGAAWFMAASHTPRASTRNLTRVALVVEEASKYIVYKYTLSREQVSYGLPVMDVRASLLGDRCPLEVDFPCQPRKFRAHSGYCNNVQSPRWGNANTRLLRFMPPHYADGVSVPRHGAKGQPLPSARDVSLAVHRDADLPHAHLMALAAVWGELVAHDIAHTPRMTGNNGERLKCCGVDFNEFHSECFPIRLPKNDPVHARTGDTCQEYARSATSPRVGCTLGPREQLNQATSFLDASVVYGNSHEEAQKLRTNQGGLLRTQPGKLGKALLPRSESAVDCRSNGTNKCFLAGDPRVNEHVGLAALHTLLMREHNRLAKELALLNPHWGDETLYQEARRIVAAEMQHITYSEFLPVALGQDIVDKFGLMPQTSGHFTGYSINLNAGVANSVAAAALQFVASLMPKTLGLFDRAGRLLGEQPVAASSYAPDELHEPGGVDRVLTGLLRRRAQKEDEFINEVMTNHMFEGKGSKGSAGLDLAAQLIQQGRDHGVPGYTKWRELCDLPKVTQFNDLSDVMSADVIAALRKAYGEVADLDLFTGGLAETPLEGAVVGPTFACLLGRQFHYLRRGDRYWYENDLPPSSFTKEQLTEIRRSSLARLICDNTDTVTALQPRVFIEKDVYLNLEVSCSGQVLDQMSLTPWKVHAPSFSVSSTALLEALKRARRDVSAVTQQEIALWQQHRTADPHSPVGTAYGFNRPTRQASEIANTSLLLQFASKRFVASFLQGELADPEGGPAPRDVRELLAALPSVDVSEALDIPRVFRCDEQTLPCDHTSKYRTATGWCNNLKEPQLGKSLRAFARLLPSVYQDGLSVPRSVSVTGSPLPSARLVSSRIHTDTSRPHTRYTLMFMQFAQILDHDLTHTPVHKGFGNSILECRDCDAQETIHPECYPIPVPQGDPHFPHVNASTGKPVCIPVTRSLPGQLTLGPREQLNQVTSYVDASFIYGSDVCKISQLRAKDGGGKLNVTRHPAGRSSKSLMPQETTHPECRAGSGMCFSAGDARSSEQPGLAAIHTLFMRDHNRLAASLARLNPHWEDERLYQEARRILSAVTQHVVYREFLPRLLGWQGVHRYELNLISEGYYDGYDSKCDATIVNEFAAAAFRFGHSLLKPTLGRMDSKFGHTGPGVRLRDTFFNPDLLYERGMVDELIRGLAATPMETLDSHITEEVTNHLFEDRRVPFSGMDLAAINIQRAREHGVTSYNEYRSFCNLTRARNFDDLKAEIPEEVVRSLKAIYAHVDDIDLFPGGLSERALPGGVVGPTFACIIARQFSNLRKCDRFWYESGDPLIRFTESQLTEIRKTSLSRIVCDNCDHVVSIQRNLLDLVDPFLNPRVPCSALPSLDLEPWKERRFCTAGENEIETGRAERISPCVMCTCTTEGAVCQSLKVGNCFQLARSFSAEAVLGDHVCKVQCAFAFRALPKLATKDARSLLGFS